MNAIVQHPPPGTTILACAGDLHTFSLSLPQPRRGHAYLRTNLGHAADLRAEIVANTEEGQPFMATDWHDVPMLETAPGHFTLEIPMLEPGWFNAKACFIPQGSATPEWPAGGNVSLKVAPAASACANSIYTAFVRQFKDDPNSSTTPGVDSSTLESLDKMGYATIPPSGTFRNLIKQLDFIIGTLGFRLIQLLPINPVPTTYARMGRFGSPFASLDYYSVDPALAEFDRRTTPLDQFRELADAIHARNARLLIDLPANHTGWASTLQTHHPEWFLRQEDGSFKSPGAWGTTWEDLVEFGFENPELYVAIADVFLFWCRQGVDGFRCDAGYMIPAQTWRYIVARVRQSYPETIFLLEGLGGKIETTRDLLGAPNLDWAYSEIFQTEDRTAFENYLPAAIALSQERGPLVHFAETHDNQRLATRGHTYARLRTALAALLSQNGAFGITSGVEWFATEKIDVHGAPSLNWDSPENQIEHIARLNSLLRHHPAFCRSATVTIITRGPGNTLVARRDHESPLLIVANLDPHNPQTAYWESRDHDTGHPLHDLLTQKPFQPQRQGNLLYLHLEPGQTLCLSSDPTELPLAAVPSMLQTPDSVIASQRRLLALRLHQYRTGTVDSTATSLPSPSSITTPNFTTVRLPRDIRRHIPLPPNHPLYIRDSSPFNATLLHQDRVILTATSLPFEDGSHGTFLLPPLDTARNPRYTGDLTLEITRFDPTGTRRLTATIHQLRDHPDPAVNLTLPPACIRKGRDYAILTNGNNAMAQVNAAWGTIRSQYDCLLAVSPNPQVPDNRRIFLTRCRAWIRHHGYSYAVDSTCATAFIADPSGRFAQWRFKVPVGMGKNIDLVINASLVPLKNQLSLEFHRIPASADTSQTLPDAEVVSLILRPDIESRDFHTKTKAFIGPEHHYPASVGAQNDGFEFTPSDSEQYQVRLAGGRFHQDSKWSYSIPHPIEIERGLGHHSDLFSPGWFDTPLSGGSSATLTAFTSETPQPQSFKTIRLASVLPLSLPFSTVLTQALSSFVVKRNEFQTVIAGYPWFLDWGRDTLIVLRGLIAAGHYEVSLEILREFGRFEEHGTIPNMIRGNDAANRETSDAPLWYFVAAHDLANALGAKKVLNARCGDRPLRQILLSLADNIIAGTPNGIHLDATSGLVFSPSHYTWMDTNYPAATPRQGYPVEIQALWIHALAMLRTHLGESRFHDIEKRARHSLATLYPLPDRGWLADCLRAAPGQPADQAIPEDTLRPNQLFAITLDALDPTTPTATAILRACEQLIVPGAIRSLADLPVNIPQPVYGDNGLLNDPLHPYWGSYLGDEDTRRKPAYHSGTAWNWPFPSYCEALFKVHGSAALKTARSLLYSAIPQLESGCVGNLPEIIDGDSPHTQRGCGAQAWSISELLRVWLLCR